MKLNLMIAAMVGVGAMGALTLSAQATKSQWDGVYTVEQAKRGEALYQQQCVRCHGRDLYGFTPDLKLGGALVDTEFTDVWDGSTLGDLYEKFKKTHPRSDPGTIPAQEAVDMLSFVLQKGKYPAGTTELPTDVAQLKMYKFLTKKPEA